MKEGRCVIVGSGHAAAATAVALRQHGWQGKILIVTEESCLPYHRPPLSKTVLAGIRSLDEIYIRSARTWAEDEIEFQLNSRVVGINRLKKKLEIQDGSRVEYHKLVLATGSRVREIPVPGNELAGICYLRDQEDVSRIRGLALTAKHAVIIGAGYIGLETASVLVKQGIHVTVIEMLDRILQRVTGVEISEFFTRVHAEEGVNIICNTRIDEFRGTGRVEQVCCSDGSSYTADLVIVGIGILPNSELAGGAGLEAENGITVDRFCRTSDPDILAAGDCTSHYNNFYNKWVRLESVQNATDQARVAAATICGMENEYEALPWFWSDQYDIKLQIAGLAQDYDDVVIRGDRHKGRSFAVFYMKAGRVIAVDAVNRPAEFMFGKRMIRECLPVGRSRLADISIQMKELLSPA